MAIYEQRGDVLEYKNESDVEIPAGAVVKLGIQHVGITSDRILSGSVGAAYVCGIFSITKKENEEIAAYTPVYFDGQAITAEAQDNVAAGYSIRASSAADTTISVKLIG